MLLKELLRNIYSEEIPAEFQGVEISCVCSDSREGRQDCLFVALKGSKDNGERFVREAIDKGAKVIISEKPLSISTQGAFALTVADPQQFLKELLIRFYDHPAEKIKVIGVTGTNGKTTASYLFESIMKSAGKTSGVIGTINHRFGDKAFKAKNTTPGLVDNYQYLSQMIAEKNDYCMMEVSSHALVQKRVDGIDFCCGVFTNLTSDHLDYHNNQEEYFQAKALLFQDLRPEATAVINRDDPFGERLVSLTNAKVQTYGINQQADILAKDIQLSLTGSAFTLVAPAGQVSMRTKLVGLHNIYNILACAGACLNENISLEKIKEGVEALAVVPGRLEQIQCGQDFSVFVDYAHTEDALKNVLASLKKVSDARIILVFGCGGDRDKSKRAKMGQVAGELADRIIVTNDNPRTEEPQTIVNEIIAGVGRDNYKVILDRSGAIKEALDSAQAGDIVLIAGKGHEDYQIFKDKTIEFKEREIIREYLKSCSS